MTTPDPRLLAGLAALRDEGVRRGLRYGMDFAIAHVPVAMSSEAILLDFDGDDLVVLYRDMGRGTELLRGRTLTEVSEPFLDEVARLARGRDRGPLAGTPEPQSDRTPSELFADMQARGYFPGVAWPEDAP